MSLMSLSRYRRIFMLMGFSLFAFGAVVRWQSKRSLGSSAKPAHAAVPAASPDELWAAQCSARACSDFDLDVGACQALCGRSLARGVPSKDAETIASACSHKCLDDDRDSLECRSECFVFSSNALAAPRRR
jgi:hypothetical protein